MKGRKRHIVVDTTGLLLAVVVHAADIQDRDGAKLALRKLPGRNRRVSKDYEAGPESSESWVQMAMIHLMIKKLRPT